MSANTDPATRFFLARRAPAPSPRWWWLLGAATAGAVLVGLGAGEALEHIFSAPAPLTRLQVAGWSVAVVGGGVVVMLLQRARVHSRRLEEYAQEFRAIADSAPAMIWTTDATGSCDYCNRAWFEFMGGAVSVPLREAWAAAIHPDDLIPTTASYAAALEARRDYRWEFRLRRHDGVYRWVMSFGAPRLDKSGAFTGYVGMCVDITAERMAAGEVRGALERFDRAVDAAEHGIWEWTAASGEAYVSPRLTEMIGLHPGPMMDVARAIRAMIGSEEYERCRAVVERAIRERTGFVLEICLQPGAGCGHAGEARWFRARGKVFQDSTGVPICVTGSMRDVTEDRRREQQLCEAKEQSEAITRLAPVGIYRSAADGTCTYVNDRWCQMAGMSAEEALGEGWLNALHPLDRERTSATWSETSEAGLPYYIEKRFVRADGSVVNIVSTAEPLRNAAGDISGYIGIAMDVTSLKRAEASLRLALHSQEMAAGRENLLRRELDHRVRNNLASLLGLLRLSEESAMDRPAVIRHLRVALRTMHDSHELISRAHGEPVRLELLVRQILRGVAAAAGTERVAACGPEVRIAPERVNALAMAMQELITNSLKHGALHAQGGRVELSWSAPDPESRRVRMVWAEECGRPIGSPAGGSGLALVRNLLAIDLEGSAGFEFSESTLTCTMEFRPQSEMPQGAPLIEGVVRA